MRRWVLSLFHEYRDIYEDRIRLQDRLNRLEGDNARLRDQLAESVNNERQALFAMVNVEWQKQYGVLPHPEAPHLPTDRYEGDGETHQLGRLPDLASVRVRRGEEEFRRKAMERIAQARGE